MPTQKSIFSYFSKSNKRKVSKPRTNSCDLNAKIVKMEGRQLASLEPLNTATTCLTNSSAKNLRASEKARKSSKAAKKKKNSPLGKKHVPFETNYMDMDWFRNPTHNDSNEVKIPHEIISRATPLTKRYFEVKAKYWDYVLFFKVGKFYEIYDRDAVICHRKLGLNFMKGKSRPHVGLPEKSYDKYAGILVANGHKVAKVDQVETVKQMQERLRGTRDPKIVKRDVTNVVTPGANFDLEINQSENSVYLLSIIEQGEQFGVCFCDSATSRIFIGYFKDDIYRTKLRRLVVALRPVETIEPSGGLGSVAKSILAERKKILRNKSHLFMEKKELFRFLEKEIYFDKIPEKLATLLVNDLSTKAFSSLFTYLKKLKIDRELMALGKFLPYDESKKTERLLLDGSTLTNLAIFENEEKTTEGSLFSWLDNCSTSFGRRLLRSWLEAPLKDLARIKKRGDAIDDFVSMPDLAESVQKTMKQIPDLDRMLGRLNAYSLDDRQAVMYENIDYRYLKLFKVVLEGLRRCKETRDLIFAKRDHLTSRLLYSLVSEGYPDFEPLLNECLEKFDLDDSLKENRVIPNEGSDPEFSAIRIKIKSVKNNLQLLLEEYRSHFSDETICYHSNNFEPHQIEIKLSTVSLSTLPEEFIESSRVAKKLRFTSPRSRKLAVELATLKEEKESLQRSFLKRILRLFCSHSAVWDEVVFRASQIDCLLSLYLASAFACGAMSRPVFTETPGKNSGKVGNLGNANVEPLLQLTDSWHPCVGNNAGLENDFEFVPNDIEMGVNKERFLMVTGPNMGGKSTLLRQVCVSVILAQIGCFVPASSCRMSLVDRIFTRIGANDAILANKSTFFLELEETSSILSNATENSLVVLDELGRGTSTFDGTAIAFAVSEYLVDQIKCRTLFSTHYHVLPQINKNRKEISLYHMAYSEEGDKIVFLYKFLPGATENSHGLNCARLAGISENIITRAKYHMDNFEIKKN